MLDAPHDVTNLLLCAPSLSEADGDACHDLTTTDSPADTVAVFVSFAHTPDEIWRWLSADGTPPADTGIVSVDGLVRSAAERTFVAADPGRPTIATAPPDDPVAIGQAVSEFLDQCGVTATGSSREVVLCFDSLTPLLQYVELQTVFRFLHLLTAQLKSVGAVAHFHIDPEAHDRQTVATLRPLFDAMYESDGDAVTVSAGKLVDVGETDAASGGDHGVLSDEEVFDLLGNGRRRRTLLYLYGEDGPHGVREVADHVARLEDCADDPENCRQSVYVSLQQSHLPRLADLDVVEYDGQRAVVSKGEQFDAVEPYLALGK